MAFISFFTVRKPRGFNYTPRYYDERKEAAQMREARIKRELGIADESTAPYRPNIRGQFQNSRQHTGAGKRSTGRTMLIALLLVGICYVLLQRPELLRLFGFGQ